MLKQQLEFSELEAAAICEMVANLVNDGYAVHIVPDIIDDTEDECQLKAYQVYIFDSDSAETAASEEGRFYLIDALAEVYQMTPEREAVK